MYEVIPTKDFKKFFKKLFKKYPSLNNDLLEIIGTLEENPQSGTQLGNNIYKIRMAISSKNKGKSAGARIISYVVTEDEEIYLVHIYDKSEISNVPKKAILQLVKNAGLK